MAHPPPYHGYGYYGHGGSQPSFERPAAWTGNAPRPYADDTQTDRLYHPPGPRPPHTLDKWNEMLIWRGAAPVPPRDLAYPNVPPDLTREPLHQNIRFPPSSIRRNSTASQTSRAKDIDCRTHSDDPDFSARHGHFYFSPTAVNTRAAARKSAEPAVMDSDCEYTPRPPQRTKRKHGRDDSNTTTKKHKSGEHDGAETEQQQKKLFACPYRKHSPHRYNLHSFKTCALTGHDTIARVKGHLYRHHRVYQCPRCKVPMKDQEDLDSHLTATRTCELKGGDIIEGFSATVEKKLRSRKKSHPDQTAGDQWEDIYFLLFPDGFLMGGPYFEPIQEGIQQHKEREKILMAKIPDRLYTHLRDRLPRRLLADIQQWFSSHDHSFPNELSPEIAEMVKEQLAAAMDSFVKKELNILLHFE